MATKTKREYFCDKCEAQVEVSKDLKKFYIGTPKTYRNSSFDLCAHCQTVLAAALPDQNADHIGLLVDAETPA